MDSGTIAGSTRGTSDFFASVFSSLEGGIERISSEVLPNWAGQQLLDQKSDLLYQPTNYVAGRVDPATATTQTPDTKPVLFDINKIGTQITAGSILAIGLIGVGGYFLFKKFF